MEENTIQNEAWPLLAKIPKEELTSLVEGYIAYSSKFKYIYFSMLGFPVIVVGYNLFFGGRRYPYSEAKSIENTFAIILCIYLLGFLVHAGLVISKLIQLKKSVNQTADKHRLDKKAVRKEFDSFVKMTIGGKGLR